MGKKKNEKENNSGQTKGGENMAFSAQSKGEMLMIKTKKKSKNKKKNIDKREFLEECQKISSMFQDENKSEDK